MGHAALARRVLCAARLPRTRAVEVFVGQAQDTILRAAEELGHGAVAGTFMDHRGTVFHRDWVRITSAGLPIPGRPLLVADNVLKPGAPLFLWQRLSEPSAVLWALPEYLHAGS